MCALLKLLASYLKRRYALFPVPDTDVRYWHKAALDEDTSPSLFTRYGSLSHNFYSMNCLCTSLLTIGLRRDFTLAGPLRPQGSFAS